MASALKTLPRPDGDEMLDRVTDRKVIAEDETFAGPAPDGMEDGEIVDPQAGMPLLASPAESLLRFITCGSVDDGKSTLIGRLLYDTQSVFDDQLEALRRDSKKFGTTGDDLDFALLVDGLSAEREQGITIDVAYRYFSTGRRAFIIADTPGHEQYTRNMATGASQAELAIILVDARKGILPQTRRHSFITSMVGIKSVIVAVNKMDLVGFNRIVFDRIVEDYKAILPSLGFTDVSYIPLSAKNGDNVTVRSPNMPWYGGDTLLERLETVEPSAFDDAHGRFRLPVQWVNRPNLDFRGFCGTVASGRVAKGDTVLSLPSRQRSTVKAVYGPSGEVESAEGGEAVTLTLNDEIDASRGDVIVMDGDPIRTHKTLRAEILWMVDRPLIAGGRFLAKLGPFQTPANVRSLDAAVDIHSYQPRAANALLMNEIGRVTVAFDRPPVATTYAENRELGAFILIDGLTNETVALGVVTALDEGEKVEAAVDEAVATAPVSTFDRAKARWLGSSTDRPDIRDALIRFRAIAAILVGIAALILGLGLVGAVVLGVLDFVGRPFLWRIMAPESTRAAHPRLDADDVGDGAGI